MEQDGADLVITIGKDSVMLKGVLKADLQDVIVTFASTQPLARPSGHRSRETL